MLKLINLMIFIITNDNDNESVYKEYCHKDRNKNYKELVLYSYFSFVLFFRQSFN